MLLNKRGETKMSKYALRHGMIVEVSDDELMHWKYIKREKKNGKWVYYYDRSANELSSLKGQVANLEYERNNKYRSHISKLKAEDYARADKMDDPIQARENVTRWYSNESLRKHEREYFNNDGEGKYITQDIERAKTKIEKHSKTIAGKVDAYMSKNGYKIAKYLNKASVKVDKAKTWLNSLFGKKNK
jgi:hypothetical protein